MMNSPLETKSLSPFVPLESILYPSSNLNLSKSTKESCPSYWWVGLHSWCFWCCPVSSRSTEGSDETISEGGDFLFQIWQWCRNERRRMSLIPGNFDSQTHLLTQVALQLLLCLQGNQICWQSFHSWLPDAGTWQSGSTQLNGEILHLFPNGSFLQTFNARVVTFYFAAVAVVL